ncbi:MAG: hypothetical protein JW882_10470 [Deltaproteobacteria bacterium]|nr:hypothetical protein [Deltaproteobacteria bacterium]
MQEYDIKGMTEKVLALKGLAAELKEISGGIPSIDRNVERILSSLRLLELQIVDIKEMLN